MPIGKTGSRPADGSPLSIERVGRDVLGNRVGPVSANGFPVPPHQRCGRNEEGGPTLARQESRERCQHDTIGRGEPRSRHLTTEHRELVTKDRDLDSFSSGVGPIPTRSSSFRTRRKVIEQLKRTILAHSLCRWSEPRSYACTPQAAESATRTNREYEELRNVQKREHQHETKGPAVLANVSGVHCNPAEGKRCQEAERARDVWTTRCEADQPGRQHEESSSKRKTLLAAETLRQTEDPERAVKLTVRQDVQQVRGNSEGSGRYWRPRRWEGSVFSAQLNEDRKQREGESEGDKRGRRGL